MASLTRKMLKAMGIEDDKIDQIIEAHSDVVDEIKTERDEIKSKYSDYDVIKKKLEDAEEALKSDNKESEYKAKYETLETEFNAFKESVENEKVFNKKQGKFIDLLKANNFIDEKGLKTIINSTKDRISGIELNDKDEIKDSDKLLASIVEDFGGFQAQVSEKGAKVSTPPAGSAGTTTMTREQIDAIKDPVERQKAMKENIDLYIKQ